MKTAKSREQRAKSKKYETPHFQARYWEHLIRGDDDLARHVAYIHWNAVKHGLVPDPDDWPHSSWHEWKREYGRPIDIPPDNWKPLHLGER